MIFYKKNKGFTLLELLVVVGIIGLLTALVLVSTTATRNKGGDAGVKSNLHTVQNQTAIYFANNNSYLPPSGMVWDDACPSTYFPGGDNMFYVDKVINDAINKAVKDSGGPSQTIDSSWCYNSASIWAVAVSLKSNAAYSWCTDSSGKSRQVSAIPMSAISATTHLCI